MRLRTIAGAYAGQIRDYAFGAAQAALKAGTAERVDTPSAATAKALGATPSEGEVRSDARQPSFAQMRGRNHRRQ